MADYSSEDYSDHDDDYYVVLAPTWPEHVRGQIEIQTQSNDLQNLIMGQQMDVTESVYFDLLPKLEAQIVEEKRGCIEQSIHSPMESYFDLEALAKSVVATTGIDVVLEAKTAMEGLAMGSYFDLETQVETGPLAALDRETVLDEIDVIESESSETMQVDTVVETVESMVEESESDLKVEYAINEPNLDVNHAVDVGLKAETTVEEGHVIGGSIYEGVESDYDLDAVEDGNVISESIYEALESDYDLDAVGEEDVINGSTYKGVESDYNMDPKDNFDMAPKNYSDMDFSDSDRTEDDMDSSDSDIDSSDSDMDSSDSDQIEEEDDVVVSFFKSSTAIRNKAWKSLVPTWAKFPVTNLEDSSLLESFLGRGPMLMLQECGNAVMNVIETLVCELLRIRNDLCYVLRALFRQRETTKHT